ncbi:hypothetical protein NCS55_00742500 [Fusarium keratoplasticum]|nr:hypothetical protein NCS55_00742500 [Fusarium keratoplasticum]
MASVLQPHTGILREENIALRQILGPPRIGQYLPGTLFKDALLVSVNVDTGGGYEAISPEQSFHIGVSIFDARCLVQKLDDPRDAITSYQFINRDSRPCKWAAKSFLFGETELMTLNDFASRISLLTKDRDYVLDTVKAAQFPLQLSYRYSVEKLLDELGNDAHFVLKALLMIAVRDGQMVREPGDEELFRYLAAVAHAP